ncbi:MAG: hypothetical protein IT453_19730 [Planctomycetes bacterium]|nr:hypothetical protein [Planctomycetota bacterium]
MAFLLLAPTVLSFLIFSAHLFRAGALIFIPPLIFSLALLAVRRPWVARFFQLLLVGIAFLWILQALLTAGSRIADGQPWVRMAVILTGVAVFALISALLFEARPLRRRYPRRSLM